MQNFYRPLSERTPDTQYRDNLQQILTSGRFIKETQQGKGALTCFGTTQRMVFDLRNGFPLITSRKLGFRMPIREITAFMNGVRDIDELSNVWGCKFWDDYKGRGKEFDMEPNDLGPGSYGAAFAAYPMPGGGTWNQFEHVVRQVREFPYLRTIRVTPWIPFYTARGHRKVIVAPCHGDLFFRVIDNELHMEMIQRSSDMALGVPNNTVQYAALLLMLCQVTGRDPGLFIHTLVDAHIYEDQVPYMEELVKRTPLPFPSMKVDPSVTDLFKFRAEHFTLYEYEAHPAMPDIPYSP
ncbi:thymidylate synthase [Candidatus Nomurabacteria bacterium]|nr:thymidylate synthase [Candidatus Nomurabacteria bacterium]